MLGTFCLMASGADDVQNNCSSALQKKHLTQFKARGFDPSQILVPCSHCWRGIFPAHFTFPPGLYPVGLKWTRLLCSSAAASLRHNCCVKPEIHLDAWLVSESRQSIDQSKYRGKVLYKKRNPCVNLPEPPSWLLLTFLFCILLQVGQYCYTCCIFYCKQGIFPLGPASCSTVASSV